MFVSLPIILVFNPLIVLVALTMHNEFLHLILNMPTFKEKLQVCKKCLGSHSPIFRSKIAHSISLHCYLVYVTCYVAVFGEIDFINVVLDSKPISVLWRALARVEGTSKLKFLGFHCYPTYENY